MLSASRVEPMGLYLEIVTYPSLSPVKVIRSNILRLLLLGSTLIMDYAAMMFPPWSKGRTRIGRRIWHENLLYGTNFRIFKRNG